MATLTLSFVFMAGAFIWLSATVDRSLHDRSQAASVAFQAARAGAPAVDPASVRGGAVGVDNARAAAAVRSTASRLLAANGDTGEVTEIRITGSQVTVTVVITTSGRRAVGTASAAAHAGFDGQDQ